MHISDYFDEVNSLIARYSSAGLIVSSNINFDVRSDEQGYIRANVTFMDRSFLHFREFISIERGKTGKLSYAYQYQSEDNQLIFRYDNAAHRPALGFLHHKHTQSVTPPSLEDVLAEILHLAF
ncbi:MAG: DUF6516 family protein [Candidatus Poribacteria bacterium]